MLSLDGCVYLTVQCMATMYKEHTAPVKFLNLCCLLSNSQSLTVSLKLAESWQ